MESVNEHRRASGILKHPVQQQHQSSLGADHVKFDEVTIAEHDKERGTRQKIDEPKTPFAEDEDQPMSDDLGGDQQITQDQSSIDYNQQDQQLIEEEVKKHLEEAERNKMLNAQLQKEQNLQNQQQADFHSELNKKLDQTQQELDEEERKHQEFLKKRKEHYRNELKAAMLLKQQSRDDDEEDEDV